MVLTTGQLVSFGEQSLYAALLCGLTGHELTMAFSFVSAIGAVALHHYLYPMEPV